MRPRAEPEGKNTQPRVVNDFGIYRSSFSLGLCLCCGLRAKHRGFATGPSVFSMVSIENVDLRPLGVEIPADRIGIVVAQLFVTLTNKEPFVATDASAAAQLAAIRRTLEISKARPHGRAKTHFTLFPEYGIPGLPGVAIVDGALNAADWPNGTIVMGGLTALTKGEYTTLLAMANTTVNVATNGAAQVKASEWVNCSVFWVKAADGVVYKWVQPKIYPAWPELKVNYKNMFRGSSIFVFRGNWTTERSIAFAR